MKTKKRNRFVTAMVRKLLGEALRGYYFFKDDTIEEFINQAELKFGFNENIFRWENNSLVNSRAYQRVVSSVLANPVMKQKVFDISFAIYGEQCN